ncbi:fimbrial biogenesis chaperone [Lysobacter arvi]|uniref:Molecular chaperone n=1 Tax=Lysobacter arvi TaxID=3038776 RepID=A0ABU1CHX2_9GAMM|nr:molecular chaperone [Lysobacter arvi]MDR0184555.1 molecular chaperone [Lysobacter arvi]
MPSLFRAAAVALLAACAFVPAVQANVLVGGTRVILPAKDGEVTLRLTNDNDTPALVQAWIDTGDAKSTPDNVDTPFLITPPMFRMEPRRDQNLRILYTREPLPADRESLFWLNVLEVPPKPADRGADGNNYLQLALRSRLKLFFRPEGLQGDAQKAPAELAFHATGNALVVNNPTAFHVTLTDLVVEVGGKTVSVEGGMVSPKSELRLAATGLAGAPAGAVVRFNAINDFGAPSPFVGAIAP